MPLKPKVFVSRGMIEPRVSIINHFSHNKKRLLQSNNPLVKIFSKYTQVNKTR